MCHQPCRAELPGAVKVQRMLKACPFLLLPARSILSHESARLRPTRLFSRILSSHDPCCSQPARTTLRSAHRVGGCATRSYEFRRRIATLAVLHLSTVASTGRVRNCCLQVSEMCCRRKPRSVRVDRRYDPVEYGYGQPVKENCGPYGTVLEPVFCRPWLFSREAPDHQCFGKLDHISSEEDIHRKYNDQCSKAHNQRGD